MRTKSNKIVENKDFWGAYVMELFQYVCIIFRICQKSVKITRTEFEICFAIESKGISLEYGDCNVIGGAKIKSPGKQLCKYKVKIQ